MKHIKMFESISLESEISEFWRIDPLEFQRVMTDAFESIDIWGEINITFCCYYPFPNHDGEALPIFYLNQEGVCKKGSSYYNFNELKKYSTDSDYENNRASVPGIEVNIDTGGEASSLENIKGEVYLKFKKFIYKYFRERNIRYGFMDNPNFLSHSYLLTFIYTGDL